VQTNDFQPQPTHTELKGSLVFFHCIFMWCTQERPRPHTGNL